MLQWLKKLKLIVAGYDSDVGNLQCRVQELEHTNDRLRNSYREIEALVRERTNIAVDAGFKSASHVIVVGRYRGADYVQTFQLDTPDLVSIVNELKRMEQYGEVRRVDAPPMFRAVFERDLKW